MALDVTGRIKAHSLQVDTLLTSWEVLDNIEYQPNMSFVSVTNTVDSSSSPGYTDGPVPSVIKTKVMTLTGSKIGIGTDNPSKMLQVKGDVLFEKRLCVGASTASYQGNPKLLFILSDDWGFYKNTDNKIISDNCYFLSDRDVARRLAAEGASAIMFEKDGSMQFRTAPSGPNTGEIIWNRIVINKNGKLGIGTETPSEQMQIGNIWTFHNGGTKFIGRNVKYIQSGNVRIEEGYSSLLAFHESGNVSLQAGGTGGQNSAINTTGKNLTLTASGNIGIGTETPYTKMQIGDIWTFHDGTNDKIIGRNCYYDSSSNVRIKEGIASRMSFGVNGDIVFQTTASGTAGASINNWNSVVIKNSGAVGIGTENIPNNYKLAVNGRVICEEVVVRLYDNWPDYVFEDDYALKSLTEIESFIQENKHLPEIPSAAQVEKTGISLAEMNALLLKKVEELTLYIIEQGKRIQALEDDKKCSNN